MAPTTTRTCSARTELRASAALVAALALALPASNARGQGIEETDVRAAALRDLPVIAELDLAHRLAVHGWRTRDPLALMTAAQLLIDRPAREVEGHVAPAGAVAPANPLLLLAEARAAADGRPHLLGLIGDLERRARAVPRGSTTGPRQLYASVAARTSREHRIDFAGGEPAVVYVSGEGGSDLDLYVYDQGGNLVARSTGPRAECIVRWLPGSEGPFRVEVRNLGPELNWYWMVTN